MSVRARNRIGLGIVTASLCAVAFVVGTLLAPSPQSTRAQEVVANPRCKGGTCGTIIYTECLPTVEKCTCSVPGCVPAQYGHTIGGMMSIYGNQCLKIRTVEDCGHRTPCTATRPDGTCHVDGDCVESWPPITVKGVEFYIAGDNCRPIASQAEVESEAFQDDSSGAGAEP